MGISVPSVHRPNGLVQFAAAILVDTDRVHPAEGHIVLRSSYLTELGDLGVTAPIQLAVFPSWKTTSDPSSRIHVCDRIAY